MYLHFEAHQLFTLIGHNECMKDERWSTVALKSLL